MNEIKFFLSQVLGIPDSGTTLNGAQHWLVQYPDFFNDFIITGFVGSVPASSPTMTTPTGNGYINGRRVVGVSTGYAFTYAISSDTYDDIDQYGAITHTAVANGNPAPAVAANSLRVQKVVTDVAKITGVTDLRNTQLAWLASVPFRMSGTLAGGTATFASVPANTIVGTTAGGLFSGFALGNGQLLIGSAGASPTISTLTGGAGVTVTNGAGTITLTTTTGSPRSYLAGLTLSNDTASATATVDIAAGVARDSTNITDLGIASTVSKILQPGGAFASGSNANGLFTGARAATTVYHVCAIGNAVSNVVDFGFDTSATCANKPSNYTSFRRIGSILTDGTTTIRTFVQDGDLFEWAVPITDIASTNPGTSAVLAFMTVPSGVNSIWIGSAWISSSTSQDIVMYLTDPAQTDSAANIRTGQFGFPNNGLAASVGVPMQVRTDTSARLRFRLSTSPATASMVLNTNGYLDSRGRNQ